MRRLVIAGAVVVLIAAGGLVAQRGLAYFDRHRTFEPTTALDKQCDDVPESAQRITLTGKDGFTLGAAVVGPAKAEVGLVLRQGASQKICEWLPWADEVAEATGARVVLFDRRGRGSSPGEGNLEKEVDDTIVAMDYLTNTGTPSVALAASSMGNSIMFSAFPDVDPCAAISISPVLISSDSFGTVDGSQLRDLPSNLWVTYETGNGGIASNAERIIAAGGAGGVVPPSLAIDTSDHSRQLLLNHPEVQQFFLDGVRSCSTG